MKNTIKISAILLLTLLLVTTARADIIPPFSHPLKRCVVFNGLDEHPEIVLIGEIVGPMPPEDDISWYQIKNNECLKKGYRFNSLIIHSTTKQYIESIGGIKNLKTTKTKNYPECDHESCMFYKLTDPNLTILTNQIDTYGGYTSAINPKVNERVTYTISVKDNKIELNKPKKDSDYDFTMPFKGILRILSDIYNIITNL